MHAMHYAYIDHDDGNDADDVPIGKIKNIEHWGSKYTYAFRDVPQLSC